MFNAKNNIILVNILKFLDLFIFLLLNNIENNKISVFI